MYMIRVLLSFSMPFGDSCGQKLVNVDELVLGLWSDSLAMACLEFSNLFGQNDYGLQIEDADLRLHNIEQAKAGVGSLKKILVLLNTQFAIYT